MDKINREIYTVIAEFEEYVLLLNKEDGRTYSYDKKTGKITLRPYWE